MVDANFTRVEKQRIRILLKDSNGFVDTTSTISVGGHGTHFTVEPVPGDNRAFDLIGNVASSGGSGPVSFFAGAKTDVVNVTVTLNPDLGSLTVSLEGPPVHQ